MSDEPEEPPGGAEEGRAPGGPPRVEDDSAAPAGVDERRRRRLLDSLVPDLVRKALREGADAITDKELREQVVSEVLRKAVAKGSEVYEGTEDSLRKLIAELPLPKEVAETILERFDDYRAELFRVVREELHEWLEKVDVGYELQRILTSLSFEITTEIRFIPNEKGMQPKPDVKARAKVKRGRKDEKER